MFSFFTSRAARKYSWLPRWVTVQREARAHPHVPEERADLFDAYNPGSTELEVLNWLHATVLMLKPAAVLETGAADGLGTIALASACKHNGLGKVHSVEIDSARCAQLDRKLRRQGLREWVEIHCQDSLVFLHSTRVVFDIGFFDSMCEIRADEFAICLERGQLRQLAIFHDTSPLRCLSLKGWPSDEEHAAYREKLLGYATDPRCAGSFESPLSRGLFCLFLKAGPRQPAAPGPECPRAERAGER